MKLLQRFFSSALLIGGLIYLLFYTPAFCFDFVVFLLIGAALFEFFTLLRQHGTPSYRFFGVSIGLVIPLVVSMEQGMTHSGEVLFLVLACLFLFLLQFSRKNNEDALVGISMTLFGILYVSWFSSFLIKMRYLPGGEIWVAYLIAVTKAGDIGAYVFGSLFGRHGLIPHVSPKKSIEGTLGGLALSMLASWGMRPYLPMPFGVAHVLILGVIIGVVAQIGDLSESLMKRFCHAKDSGSLLPGMGGILDVADSILFTAPIFIFISKYLSHDFSAKNRQRFGFYRLRGAKYPSGGAGKHSSFSCHGPCRGHKKRCAGRADTRIFPPGGVFGG